MARPDPQPLTAIRRNIGAGSSANNTNNWWSNHPEAYITLAVVLGVVGIVCLWILFRENRGLPILPWRKPKSAEEQEQEQEQYEQELEQQQHQQQQPPFDPASWRGAAAPDTIVLPERKRPVSDQKIMSPPRSFTTPPVFSKSPPPFTSPTSPPPLPTSMSAALLSSPLPAYPFPNRPHSNGYYDRKAPTSPTSPVSPRSPASPNDPIPPFYGNQGRTNSFHSERSDASTPSLSTSSVRLVGPVALVTAQQQPLGPRSHPTSRLSLPNSTRHNNLTVPLPQTRRPSSGTLASPSRLSQVTTPDDIEKENPMEAAGRGVAVAGNAGLSPRAPGSGTDGYPPRRVSFTVQDPSARPALNRRMSPPRAPPAQLPQQRPEAPHWAEQGDVYNAPAPAPRRASSARKPVPPSSPPLHPYPSAGSPPLHPSAAPDALHRTMHTLTHGSRHNSQHRPRASLQGPVMYDPYAYGPAGSRGSASSVGPPPPHLAGPPVQLPPLDLNPHHHHRRTKSSGTHAIPPGAAPSRPPPGHGRRPSRGGSGGGLWVDAAGGGAMARPSGHPSGTMVHPSSTPVPQLSVTSPQSPALPADADADTGRPAGHPAGQAL